LFKNVLGNVEWNVGEEALKVDEITKRNNKSTVVKCINSLPKRSSDDCLEISLKSTRDKNFVNNDAQNKMYIL
jgi:hypothetical protein